MKKSLRLLVLLPIVLLVAAVAFARPQDATDMAVRNKKFVEKIVGILKNKSLLNNEAAFENAFAAKVQKRDIGLGCFYITLSVQNNLGIRIYFTSFNGKILRYVIDFSADQKRTVNEIIAGDADLSNAVATLGTIKKTASFSYLNGVVYNEFKEHAAQELGAITENDSLKGCSANATFYAMLLDPIYSYYFSHGCGSHGDPPEESKAIDYFNDTNDIDVIRSLIRGYNPEGRIYAIEILLEKAEYGRVILTDNDKRTIKKVLDMNILINRCIGCGVDRKKGREVISPGLLRLLQ